MEDTLVSLFGPVWAKLWVATVTLTTAAYSLELIFREFNKSKPKRKPPRVKVVVVRRPTWPPRIGNLN